MEPVVIIIKIYLYGLAPSDIERDGFRFMSSTFFMLQSGSNEI
jgi:hypothetical protein